MRTTLLVLAAVISLGIIPARAQQAQARSSAVAAPARAADAEVRSVADTQKNAGVDLATLRPQMQAFADYLNRDLQANLENPFALLQDPKGMYLPGFGVAFHMEVNLHPLRVQNPFDDRPYTPEELAAVHNSKLQRIQQLQAQLSDVLLAHGADMAAVPADQNIAVVVHLFNLPWERTEGLPLQLVIEISRGALQQLKNEKTTAQDFRQRVTALEF